MNDPSLDPPRIADDAQSPAGLRGLFESAQRDVSSRDALAPLWRRVARETGGGPPASVPVKVVTGLLAVVAIGAVIVWLASREESEATHPVSSPTSAMPEPPSASEAQPPSPESSVVEPSASTPVEVPPPSSPSRWGRREPPHAAPAPAPPAPAAAPTIDAPALSELEEGRILLSARRALPADPASALRLADEHRARAPQGRLTQEREAIAIEALGALGRTSEAHARALRFLERWPSSPHRSIALRWRDAARE